MITLRLARWLTIAMIVVGVLAALVGLISGDVLGIVVGAILAVVGILSTINPMVVLKNGEFQVRSPLGFTGRRFPVSGPQDVRVEGNKLVHVPTGKKIASLGWGMDPSGSAAAKAWAAGGQAPGA